MPNDLDLLEPGMDPWGNPAQEIDRWGGGLQAGYAAEAQRLRRLEERDRAGALDFHRAAYDATAGDPVRDSDINRMYSGMASTAGRQALQAQRNVKQGFANSGVIGGNLQTAALTGTELERYGKLSDGRAGLKQFQWQENAAHKWRRMGAATGVTQTMLSPRSAVGLDAIGDLLGFQAQKEADQAANERARQTSRDNRQSGLIGAGASVVGSLIGLI